MSNNSLPLTRMNLESHQRTLNSQPRGQYFREASRLDRLHHDLNKMVVQRLEAHTDSQQPNPDNESYFDDVEACKDKTDESLARSPGLFIQFYQEPNLLETPMERFPVSSTSQDPRVFTVEVDKTHSTARETEEYCNSLVGRSSRRGVPRSSVPGLVSLRHNISLEQEGEPVSDTMPRDGETNSGASRVFKVPRLRRRDGSS